MPAGNKKVQVMWIMVANESDARIFKNEGPGKEILLVQKFEHPEGRKRNQDFNADRYGRSFGSVGHGRSSMEPEVTPRVHEREVFAHRLVHFLEKEFASHRFEKLTLLAPPHFLGELRRTLSNGLQKSIDRELDKDLPSSWITDHELIKMLKKKLDL